VRIAICDDETRQTALLSTIVQNWAAGQNINATIAEFPSAEAFLFDWEPNSFDILLLDIQMAEMDGMDLAKKVREKDSRAAIIFVTGYDKFMHMGYDVAALHYLLKPVSKEKLHDVLTKARQGLAITTRVIALNTVDGMVRVAADEIIFAEMFSHYAEIHVAAQDLPFRVKIKMGELEELLGEGFFRPHRSYIGGMAHVDGVSRAGMRLSNGRELPISRNLYDAAHKAFIQYNFRKK